jgi:hypothetical protein
MWDGGFQMACKLGVSLARELESAFLNKRARHYLYAIRSEPIHRDSATLAEGNHGGRQVLLMCIFPSAH